MERDEERTACVARALEEAGVDALVCALPMNVLLLSGYWPVVGTSLAVFTREGRATLLVPEDEEEIAARGWADDVRTFSAGSLTELKGVVECVRGPLAEAASDLGVGRGCVVGFEDDDITEPASYAEGFGGMRHCDVVAVTDEGVEVLTPFQFSVEELTRT